MDTETKRANILELIDLLESARRAEYGRAFEGGEVYWRGFTSGELAEFHTNAGLIGERSFDFGLPQGWFDAYFNWVRSPSVVYSGIAKYDRPVFVVWTYPERGQPNHIFGGPYALTSDADRALRAFVASRS